MTQPIRILTIDDEAAIRMSFTHFLEDWDYQVRQAEDGEKGLALVRSWHPDLVLLDLKMPHLDGLGVLERMSQDHQEIPIIVISGTGEVSEAMLAIAKGAWDFLTKPIENMDILLHSVQRTLDRARLKRENKAYQLRLESMVAERTERLDQANKELKHINERLKQMVQSTNNLGLCNKSAALGKLLLHEFCRNMASEGGSFYLKANDRFELQESIGPSVPAPTLPDPLIPGTISHHVITTAQPILVENLEETPFQGNRSRSIYRDGSTIAFPFFDEANQKVIGVIFLHNRLNPPFTPQDLELGTLLAGYSCERIQSVQASEDIKAREKRYRRIFENLTGTYFEVGIDGRFQELSPSVEGLLGVSRETALTLELKELLSVHMSWQTLLKLILKTGKLQEYETEIRRPNGSIIPVVISATLSSEDTRDLPPSLYGSATGWMIFGMVHDISLRKKSEAKLIQAQKMDSIGALAGGIAHDFKNVLSGISGFTSLLMRNESNPQRLEYCQRILNAIQRSAEMTNKLLSFGRQEQASTQPLDVNALIVDVLKLIEPTVPATIKTLLKLEEDLPALLGDPTHFRQILLNLCVNALEAMPLGGTLTIASRMADTPPQILLTAPTTATDMMLAIIISDSGHGMDETVRGKIFEPFFTTKHGEHKGTGLGLATTYTLVNKMSGHIDLQSAVGLGTTFTLYFPIVDRRDARGRRSDKEGSATRPTVLVVDDEPAIVDFLSEILNLEGFRVRTCHDGSGALTLLDKFHDAIDCLVIDQNMPTTTGIQTIEQLRAKGLRLPCILLSGLREQQLPLSEHVEVNHILEKPFDPMKLVFLIRSLLSEP